MWMIPSKTALFMKRSAAGYSGWLRAALEVAMSVDPIEVAEESPTLVPDTTAGVHDSTLSEFIRRDVQPGMCG